jgi:hypothetical protein
VTCWFFLQCPCLKTRLLKLSSREVQSSFAAYPQNVRPAPLDPEPLSWDFVPLQRIQTTRVHVHPGEPRWPPGLPEDKPDSASRPHPANYGAAHRLSQPPSDFLLSLPPCHFQTGSIHGVHPSGNYSFHEASGNSSPPDYPPAVPPAGRPVPDPRPRTPLGVRHVA